MRVKPLSVDLVPEPVGLALVRLDGFNFGDGAVLNFETKHIHGLAAIRVADNRLSPGVAAPRVDDVESKNGFRGTIPERIREILFSTVFGDSRPERPGVMRGRRGPGEL